jgi:acetyltransferase-like isoleucine patch superfamily enzyme
MGNIHPTAIISASAKLHKNVTIGPFSIVNENVEIGENTYIGAFCEIGTRNNLCKTDRLVIGNESIIRSHSVLYSGSMFADKLDTGHHVTLRENLLVGSNLRVGSYSDLQGDIQIGNYSRIQSNVHLCKFTKIGNFVFIYQFSITTNDPTPPSETINPSFIDDFAVLSVGSTILPGITIGKHALVGANSTVTKNVEPYSLVLGSPARKIKDVRLVKSRADSNEMAYPWHKHFKRGLPDLTTEILGDN